MPVDSGIPAIVGLSIALRADRSRLRQALLGVVFICVWVLQRDPLSKRMSLIVMSYHEVVAAVLILVVMTLTVRGAVTTAARGDRVADPEPAQIARGANSS